MARDAALREALRAELQESLGTISQRLDALEEGVAELNARLAPAQDRAAAAPKRGTRSKPPADAVVEDVELPQEG